jgi:hypothetical protein
MLLHSQDKSFTCNHCTRHFNHAGHLRRHIQLHHSDGSQSESVGTASGVKEISVKADVDDDGSYERAESDTDVTEFTVCRSGQEIDSLCNGPVQNGKGSARSLGVSQRRITEYAKRSPDQCSNSNTSEDE